MQNIQHEDSSSDEESGREYGQEVIENGEDN